MLDRLPTKQDWLITCWTCEARFLVDTEDMRPGILIVCSACKGWSGFKWQDRPVASVSVTVGKDHGQGRLVGELWAWLTVDPRTNLESICGVQLDDGLVMAIAPTREAIKKLQPFIEEGRRISQKRFRLVRFSKAEVEEEL